MRCRSKRCSERLNERHGWREISRCIAQLHDYLSDSRESSPADGLVRRRAGIRLFPLFYFLHRINVRKEKKVVLRCRGANNGCESSLEIACHQSYIRAFADLLATVDSISYRQARCTTDDASLPGDYLPKTIFDELNRMLKVRGHLRVEGDS